MPPEQERILMTQPVAAAHARRRQFSRQLRAKSERPKRDGGGGAPQRAVGPSRAVSLNGTSTGEHGNGCGKIDFLIAEHGEAVSVMRAIKKAIDLDNIMNRARSSAFRLHT